NGRVQQAGDAAITRLAAVLNAEKKVPGPAGVLLAPGAVGRQGDLQPVEPFQQEWKVLVAEEFQLPHGRQATGAAGMALHEDQLTVLNAGGTPLQVIFDPGRLAVFVDAEEAYIEVITRILEVVGVAPIKGDLLLRREDQPNVGVFLESIEMILAALVQGNDVA